MFVETRVGTCVTNLKLIIIGLSTLKLIISLDNSFDLNENKEMFTLIFKRSRNGSMILRENDFKSGNGDSAGTADGCHKNA